MRHTLKFKTTQLSNKNSTAGTGSYSENNLSGIRSQFATQNGQIATQICTKLSSRCCTHSTMDFNDCVEGSPKS